MITVGDVGAFLLVFLRLGGIFIFFPIFQSKEFPAAARLGFTFLLSALVFRHAGEGVPPPGDSPGFLWAAVMEIAVGFFMGLLVQAVFAAVQAAGSLANLQMGFGLGAVYDPQFSEATDVLSEIKRLAASALFIGMDGHCRLLESLVGSYRLVPLGGVHFTTQAASLLISTLTGFFILAVQLAAPVLIAMGVVTLFLGLVGRAIPQLNVFILDFPIRIAAGMSALILGMPFFSIVFQRALQDLWREMALLLKALGG